MGDLATTSNSAPVRRPKCGSVLVRGLIHRLRARDEVMPIECALALAIAMARRIDDVGPRRVTPSSVLVFFDGTVELAESWAGTPDEMGYVPPEQLLAGTDDGGTAGAVFGVGAILYELLTGAAPFARADDAATRYAVLCEVALAPSTVCADVPGELDDILAVALAKDHDVRYLRGIDLAEALERAAANAGLAVSFDEVGKLGRRLAQGVRLAHTVRTGEPTPAPSARGEKSTRRMQVTELTRLGALDAAELAEPAAPLDAALAAGSSIRPVVHATSMPTLLDPDADPDVDPDHGPDDPAAFDTAPTEEVVELHRVRTAPPEPLPIAPTAKVRRGSRLALAIGILLLVGGVVAFAAVPVFRAEPPPAPARCQTCQVSDPPPPADTAPYDRSLSIPSSSDPASAPRTPRTPADAERAFRVAESSHAWTAASAACTDLLGHTSSRRLRTACAIASCRAGETAQRDAFVAGLSRSRRAQVARACAR